MTNFEWIKNMDAITFAKWFNNEVDICTDVYPNCSADECDNCMYKWLSKKHENPMPTITNGMFVIVKRVYNGSNDLMHGFIYNDTIIYQNGSYDILSELIEDSDDDYHIEEIYDLDGDYYFNKMSHIEPIWKYEG